MEIFYNLTALLSLIELSTIQQRYAKLVQQICENVAAEHEIYTFVYAGSGTTNQFQLDIPTILQKGGTHNPIPVLNNDSLMPAESYVKRFNNNLLSIVQLSEDAHRNEELLQTMWQRLDLNRQSRLILLLADKASESYVRRILANCVANYAINVIALQPHVAINERSYWTLQLFPKPQTVRRNFRKHYRKLFPKHMKDMSGHHLRVLENGWHPQLYNFTARDGTVTLSGYLGRTLTEYTQRRNGTIRGVTLPTKTIYNYSETLNVLLTDRADTGPLWPIQLQNTQLSYSTVFHYINVCLMVPAEKALSKVVFYRSIISVWVIVLLCTSLMLLSCICTLLYRLKRQRTPPLYDYFINIYVFQGLIGLPFWTRKNTTFLQRVIYIMISFSGVIIGTAYNTHLQSFSVEAPIAQSARIVDDILGRGIKIAASADNLPWLMNITYIRPHVHKLTLFDNYTEFLTARDKLDTHYAFIVTDMWTVYNEQQKHFTRPLFRLTDICFGKQMPMVLPLPRNSVYRHNLNEFLERLHEVGLKDYWLHHSFVELVEMDYISLKDRNPPKGFKSFRVQDLRLILREITILFCISIVCFIFEVNWLKIRKLCNLILKFK